MKENHSGWSESDYESHYDRLRAEAATLGASLVRAGKSLPVRPPFNDQDAIASCEAMEGYLAELRTMASLAGIKTLEQRGFSAGGSAAPAVHFAPAAPSPKPLHAANVVAQPSNPMKPTKKLSAQTLSELSAALAPEPTATEKVLAAKGAASLEELGARSYPAVSAASDLTATEKVLAAKGAKSLGELAARKSGGAKATALAMLAAVIAFTAPAKAQEGRVYQMMGGLVDNIPALTTNPAVVIRCDDFVEISLQAVANGHSGTASNVQFQVYRSLDSSTYETDPYAIFQLRLSGTATNSAITNLALNGARTIKIIPANTNGVVVTNLTLKAGFKSSNRKISTL